MIIRAAFRPQKDDPGRPGLASDGDPEAPVFIRPSDDADPLTFDPGPEDRSLVDMLRGLDLDALLAGAPGTDFLFPAGRAPAAPDGFAEQVETAWRPDLDVSAHMGDPLVLPGVPDPLVRVKDADVAQVLPGVTDDDFLHLGKDADLPLVLPGEYDVPGMLEPSLNPVPGLSNHMLILDAGEGGFRDLDAARLLPDHDDWLF